MFVSYYESYFLSSSNSKKSLLVITMKELLVRRGYG